MDIIGQPQKHEADDLSFLYDFISQCPNPQVTEALKKLVAQWLAQPNTVPHLPTTIKKQLLLTNEEVLQVCWLLAINPNTPPSVLQDLLTDSSSGLLEQTSKTNWTTLSTLSYQAVAEIRIAAASNPNTPLASVMILVKDNNPDIRFCIAEDPNLPTEALQALTGDDNAYVRLRAEKTLNRLELVRKENTDQAQADA